MPSKEVDPPEGKCPTGRRTVRNQFAQTERDETQARAGRYLEMGRDYIAAVEMLAAQSSGASAVHAFWAMASHGLELTLKACLRASGCDEERLMMINHSLGHCLDVCRQLDRDNWDPELVTLLELLDAPHAAQSFRYPGWKVDFDALPSPEEAARTLILHLERIAASLDDDGPRSS